MIVIMVMMVVIMVMVMVVVVMIIVIIVVVLMVGVMSHVGGDDTCQADRIMGMVIAVPLSRGRSRIERHNAETSCGGLTEHVGTLQDTRAENHSNARRIAPFQMKPVLSSSPRARGVVNHDATGSY